MINKDDPIGKKFNAWTIIENNGRNKWGNKLFTARCECGTLKCRILYYFRKHKSCQKHSKPFPDNIIGKTFNSWTVINFLKRGIYGKNKNYNIFVNARCVCGQVKIVRLAALKNGKTKQCKDCRTINSIRHGRSKSKIHNIWRNIKTRCYNPNTAKFHLYGGRGIKVCERWLKFENFLEDMGERPKNYQLDRINPDGNYEPGNCRWVSPKENQANRRNSSKYRGQYIYVRKDKLCKKCAEQILNLKTI